MLRSKRCIVQIVVEKLKMENVIALIVERKHLMNMNLINIEYIMQFLDVVFQCVLFYQLLRLEFMDFIGFIVLPVMSIHLLEKKILQVLKS